MLAHFLIGPSFLARVDALGGSAIEAVLFVGDLMIVLIVVMLRFRVEGNLGRIQCVLGLLVVLPGL